MMKYEDYIQNVPDFPIPGIQFKDITTLIGDGLVFHAAIEELAQFAQSLGAEVVVGPDARGFIIGILPVNYGLTQFSRQPNALQ